jgi:glycosyltransferase involved in cell wall biosynthesis
MNRKKQKSKRTRHTRADQPTLSLCMIAKDEAGFLRRCLASVKGLADEIVVGDTGSKDGTSKVAARAGAKVIDVSWSGDFSAARNAVLDSATGDWVLVLDCDEVLASQDLSSIRKAISSTGVTGFRMTTRNYGQSGNRVGWQTTQGEYAEEKTYLGWFPTTKVRLFQNQPQIRFEGAIHELVEGSIKRLGGTIRDLATPVHHYGYVEKDRPDQMYAEVARRKAEDDPENPEAFYQLALALRDSGDLHEARRAISRSIHLLEGNSASPTEYLQNDFVYLVSGDISGRLGDKEAEESAYQKALKANPKCYQALNNLGAIQQRQGNYAAALSYYQEAHEMAPAVDTIRENVNRLKAKVLKEDREKPGDRRAPSSAKGTTGRLTLCMIAKNEAHRIGKCLDSVKDLVDEIVVVDTGSTDRTLEIVMKYGAKTGFFEWCDDFSAARNQSLSLATGDWIMWLDPDDVLPRESHAKIREVMAYGLNKKKAFYWILDDRGYEPVQCLQMRLFPNLPGVAFTMPIHEQVTPSLAAVGVTCEATDIRVEHYGYATPDIVKEKQNRYLGIIEKWLNQHPEDYIVRSHAAMTYYIRGKLDQAIGAYQKILDDGLAHKDRNLVIETTAHLFLGRSLMRQHNYESALPHLLDAQKLDDQYMVTNLTLGECYTRMGRHQSALDVLALALKYENQVTFSATDVTAARYSIRYFTGQNMEALGRWQEAADWHIRASETDARRGDALGRLSGVYRHLGEKAKAVVAIDEALKRDPTNPHHCLNRGSFFLESGDEAEALLWFRKALDINPEMPGPYLNIGFLMRRGGDLKAAEDMYERAIALSGEADYEAQANCAHMFLDAGRYSEADPLFEEVERRHPGLTDILLGLCVTKASSEDFEAIRLLLPRILNAVYGGALDGAHLGAVDLPGLANLLSECGSMLLQQNQGVCARLSFQAGSILDRTPENLARLAEVYRGTGTVWKAIEIYESLIQLQPTNPEWFRRLGVCYRAIGSEASAHLCEQQVQALTG